VVYPGKRGNGKTAKLRVHKDIADFDPTTPFATLFFFPRILDSLFGQVLLAFVDELMFSSKTYIPSRCF
jgi:hypothetical protein